VRDLKKDLDRYRFQNKRRVYKINSTEQGRCRQYRNGIIWIPAFSKVNYPNASETEQIFIQRIGVLSD
jgi:hypothetical protein